MNYTFLFGISCNSGRDLAYLLHRNILCKFATHVHVEHQAHSLKQPYTMSNVSIYFVISFAHCPLPLLFFVCQLSKCII